MADHHHLHHLEQHQQQFCLRWNNHGSTLVAVFDNLLASESLVDVTLFAEGHLLKAHKVVLSACSPYFQTLFAQTTDKHPIVILKDVKHDELKALLEYMYRGEVNVAQDQLGPLIKTAESLKIKGLADGSSSSSSGNNTKVSDGDLRSTHPAGLELPKSDGEGKSSRSTLNSFPLPQVPQVSVPSVLSTVLTMPPALSLASSTLVPPIKLPSLSQSAGTPTDGSSHEDNDSPLLQRRKRMRRKSGETCESGDSDGRSSGSPGGESIHLPRIPATITPVVGPHHNFHREQQQLKERERELEREIERERERERERSLEREGDWKRDSRDQEGERDSRSLELSEQFRPSSPSPENLVGSSRGSVDIPRSSPSITRSHLEYERSTLSPNKALALLGRPEENSSDANHMSDDEYDYKPSMPVHESHPDTPGPSTSRPRPDDSHKPGNYLGWPYPPDTSGTSEDSYSALENANQGLWKSKFLAPYLGSPLTIPPRSHHPGIGSPFPGLYAPPSSSPWGRHSPPTPTTLSAAPPLMRANECSRCGRLYKTRKGLKHHIKNECGVEPRFQCIHCDWKFKQKAHLLRHVARKHMAS
ncbi:longitudinals lacking protein, isoforms A/B/D/L-like isoform X3 [Macrobrachium rosenbergii]|uniref:longitudinals lacking protein, isoforms A/B/D/L-like isoform X3 n=1 Tax=Macrobrachium rosenbergii TaxID=79674 RepID=UPI0034D6855F